MSLKKLFFPLGILLFLIPAACTEKESDLGVDLQDPFTLYNGIRDTAYMTGCTIFDDSLWTAGYPFGIFGDYEVGVFGKVKAVTYSQIVISSTTGINLSDDVIIDSVVMTLLIDTVYPVLPDSTPIPLHFVINQLAEPLKDSTYLVSYASESMEESNVCFFDDVVTYYADSVRLRMREDIYPVLKQNCTTEEFAKRVKGFSLKLADNSNKMVSVDFSATDTRLTLYYHTANADSLRYVFVISSDAGRSMYFQHDYTGTVLAPIASHAADSIDGSQLLYLEPLGGTRLRLNMQPFLDEFRAKHPWAVIHYAELILPVNEVSDTQPPVRIMANKILADGNSILVTDADFINNNYAYVGFDGYYNKEKKCYRLRVSRHLQELLRSGKDHGTELYIDARRTSAFRTVLNGTASQNPVRIDFVYTENNN